MDNGHVRTHPYCGMTQTFAYFQKFPLSNYISTVNYCSCAHDLSPQKKTA